MFTVCQSLTIIGFSYISITSLCYFSKNFMKNVVIFHGTGGTPDSFWFPYVKNSLLLRNYHVWVPQLPDTNSPSLENQLPFALKNYNFNKETIIIGHSSGCPLALAVLEKLDIQIHQVILVASFSEPLTDKPNPILQDSYNWEKIKGNANYFININSVDDPWGCNEIQGRKIFDQLGGDLIIKKEGHMGSDSFNQQYKEFPLILGLVDSYAK